MTKHRRILNLIDEIRNSHSQMKNIFLYGSCLNLFCILKAVYPEARAWTNQDHVITKIDDRFYDITGSVSSKGYRPILSVFGKRTSRAFTQMYSYEFCLGRQYANSSTNP